MRKVVIIDDEPIIVEGLSRTIEWERWNLRVAGLAYDGKEGLEVIRRERPDIVITDICMPNLDGLKMLAALKSEFPYMQVSILTGYRDFNYAKEAIKLGVSRFLLKPSKIDEVNEAIGAMTDRLEEIEKNHPEAFEKTPLDEAEDDGLVSSANSFVVKNAMDYIRDHYCEKLRLVDVADAVYVSQWHLSKLLNKYMGSNFSDILNKVRMEKAKDLLKDPSLKIHEIAERVGFTDLTHFSRVFKKIEGISANDYRNGMK